MIPTLRDRRGVALLTALAVLVVVSGIAALMFARTLGEIRHSADDTGIVQSLLLARGASNLGGAVLQGPGRDALDAIVAVTSSTAARWSYGTGTGDAPRPASVANALSRGNGSVAARFQSQLDGLLCDATVPTLDGGETLALRVYVTDSACGVGLPGGVELAAGRFVSGLPRDGSGSANDQTYGLPFVIVAEGSVGPYTRNVVTNGEYRFTVGRASFAQYALFTNVHRTGGGWGASDVWFTDATLFDGPVHTNQYFRFYRQPWFGALVTSAGCANPGATGCTSGAGTNGAEFYGEGFESVAGMPDPLRYANAYGVHEPDFVGGVDWNATFVPLPGNSQDQQQAANDAGLAFGNDLISLRLMATDADMNPLPTAGTVPDATYQFIEACRAIRRTGTVYHLCEQYRYRGNQALEARSIHYIASNGGVSRRYPPTDWAPTGVTFNGVIHTDGDIDRLTGPTRAGFGPDSAGPALAQFAQITVAAEGDIRITGDLQYERPPCTGAPTRDGEDVDRAVCDDLDAENILGIYSQGGDVRIGHNNAEQAIRGYRGTRNAPVDVTLHAVMMSSTGIVGVDNYDSGGSRGSVNLLGGIIEYYYGAFGTFNPNTGQMNTGYSRAFTWDRRTGDGLSPPYFPTIGDDGVKSVRAFAFAQREQVE